MEESLKKQIEATIKKAKDGGRKSRFSRCYSSLHQIIKTKEQAEKFMKLLNSA